MMFHNTERTKTRYGNVPQAVLPLKKFYPEQMFVLLRTKRMQLRNHADTNSEAFPTLKVIRNIYIPYYI